MRPIPLTSKIPLYDKLLAEKEERFVSFLYFLYILFHFYKYNKSAVVRNTYLVGVV